MPATEQSFGVMLWWSALSAIGVANILAWLLIARREEADEDQELRRERLYQIVLSGLFTFGCAYRSFLPLAEAQRIVLVNMWFSNAFVSRTIATIAELSIAAQWALFVGHWTRAIGSRIGWLVSRVLVPAIAFAEINSWYTALTTNFAGSVIEESTWAVTSALMTITLVSLWWRRREVRRPFIGAAIVLNAFYVMFMATVDVPMYKSRVRADTAAHKTYLSVGEGARDSVARRVVTRRWDDWKDEMPWMTLYFSVGVWISLSLIRAPRLKTGLAT